MKSINHVKRHFTPGQFLGALAALFLGIASVAYAITIPNTFTAGTAISAAQVNANFTAVNGAINNSVGWLSVNGATGAIIQQSGGFAVVRTAVGNYTVTHPGSLAMNLVAPMIGSYNRSGAGTAPALTTFFANGATSLNVYVWAVDGVTALDHDFTVHIPRHTEAGTGPLSVVAPSSESAPLVDPANNR